MNNDLEQEVKKLREQVEELLKRDRMILNKELQMQNGRNIIVGTGNGTKIATEATQKLGFFGVTPVAQQTTVADPTGGATQDTEARQAINDINDRLDSLGLTG